MKKSQKFDYIYIAKGLAMLAVVWGHTMLSGETNYLVYGFDIPLFFFLSGMVFKREKYPYFNDFFKNRVKRLLVPYLIFSLVSWFEWVLYNLSEETTIIECVKPLLQTFIAQGSSDFMDHNLPLWFVPCLFVIEMLYYLISKAHSVINIVLCTGFAVLGYFMIQPDNIIDFTLMPWSMEGAFRALIFYSLGNNFVKLCGLEGIPNFIRSKKIIAILVWAVFTGLFIWGALYNGHVSIGSNITGKNNLVFYGTAIAGIASTMIFSSAVENLIKKRKLPLSSYIKWVGLNSFYFMSIHMPVQKYVMPLAENILAAVGYELTTESYYDFNASLITWAFMMIITSLIIAVINALRKAGSKSV